MSKDYLEYLLQLPYQHKGKMYLLIEVFMGLNVIVERIDA